MLISYDNESEIWIYDEIFPIQRAMAMDHKTNKHIKFIAHHIINIQDGLVSQYQFMRIDDKDHVYYIERLRNIANQLIYSLIS